MNCKNGFIDSAGTIVQKAKTEFDILVKKHQVLEVLKKDCGMTYRRIKPISLHANSPKNLVLRQQFALVLLNALKTVRHIINVDETWLGMSDFRRMRWERKGATNSFPQLQVRPRITMVLGLSTTGSVYLSLLQSNSNSKIMEIFFRDLVRKLDKERKDWRSDSLIFLDNAPYHTSAATLKLFKDLSLPICFTGPHSYDSAPVEKMFAHFKAADINPNRLPMNKR